MNNTQTLPASPSQDPSRDPSMFKRITSHTLFWPGLTLALLLIGNGIFNPGFLNLTWHDGHLYGNLVDILNRAAPLMLVSMGMTLVIAVRGLDISVGAVVAISAAVVAWMIGGELHFVDGVPTAVARFPLWMAIGAAMLAAVACGLLNGSLVVGIGLQPIIATLILMVAGRGIAQLITGGQILTIYYPPFFVMGNGYLLGLPVALWIALATFAVLWLLLERTALGLFIRAIGINPLAARVAGIRSAVIAMCLYVFCACSAGMAGLIISSNVKSADANNAGQLMELDAILAVTLGGTLLTGGRFSLGGSLLGALIIQTLTSTIYSIGVPPQVNMVIKAVMIFAVMLLQSADFRQSVIALAKKARR